MDDMVVNTSVYLEDAAAIPIRWQLAVTFGGADYAAIIQQVQYWINRQMLAEYDRPADRRKHWHPDHNGVYRWWTYASYNEWQKKNFRWMSKRTVERKLSNLVERGVLIANNFNKRNGDKTLWYTIDYIELDRQVEECLEKNGYLSLTPSRQSGVMVTTKWHDGDDKVAGALPVDDPIDDPVDSSGEDAETEEEKAERIAKENAMWEVIAIKGFGWTKDRTGKMIDAGVKNGSRVTKIRNWVLEAYPDYDARHLLAFYKDCDAQGFTAGRGITDDGTGTFQENFDTFVDSKKGGTPEPSTEWKPQDDLITKALQGG